MTPKLVLSTLAAAAVFAVPTLHAAGSGDMEKEYQQIRTVALRDSKVRAAYEAADRRLAEKIVQLDPALAGYHSHGGAAPEKIHSTPKPTVTAAPQSHTKAAGGFHAPHTSSTSIASAPAAHTAATHTVASGETLGGIASKYGVTVAALKSANHIADEKKLGVGQVLTIPAKKSH